jgi:hypothetical protein
MLVLHGESFMFSHDFDSPKVCANIHIVVSKLKGDGKSIMGRPHLATASPKAKTHARLDHFRLKTFNSL